MERNGMARNGVRMQVMAQENAANAARSSQAIPQPFLAADFEEQLKLFFKIGCQERLGNGLGTPGGIGGILLCESEQLIQRTLAGNMAEKGSSFVVGLLVMGNIIIMLSGLALYAESIWVTADPYKVYPIMGVSGKDDVYAGAWISIFTGFSFFCVCVFGIISLVNGNRLMVLLYLVLILVVYLFECASCITSYTHRDYVVSNSRLITKQMLSFYSADSHQGRELTRMWNRFMMEQQCCGTNNPLDWVNYTSVFRSRYPEVVAPWPFYCCKRDRNFIIINEEGCRLGHVDYINTQGCFEHIKHAVQSYAWGVSWFGFAILMLTCPVVLLAIYHYTTM